MFVGISNAQFEVADQYGNWTVSDYYGTVVVDDYYFKGVWPCIEPGDQFSCLSGVVGYSYGAFKIYPRNIDDFSCLDDNCNSNGDVNLDNSIDVLDIVSIVNAIVGSDSLNEQEQCSADINEDNSVDVLDIVLIVSIILN